jgi:hypothetical protein
MRTQRITGAINWRYALGEVALIVVGVMIALQASSWWDRLEDRRAERAFLAEMIVELTNDQGKIASGLERYVKIEASVSELLAVMRSGQPYTPELDRLFGAVYGANAFDLSAATFESLKSHGITLISNGELRARIARVYEETYERMRRSIRYEESFILDLLRPYFLANFRDLRFNKSATPLDYEAISKSEEFINLIDYRLQLTRQNQLPEFERAIGQIDALIAALDEELSD